MSTLKNKAWKFSINNTFHISFLPFYPVNNCFCFYCSYCCWQFSKFNRLHRNSPNSRHLRCWFACTEACLRVCVCMYTHTCTCLCWWWCVCVAIRLKMLSRQVHFHFCGWRRTVGQQSKKLPFISRSLCKCCCLQHLHTYLHAWVDIHTHVYMRVYLNYDAVYLCIFASCPIPLKL